MSNISLLTITQLHASEIFFLPGGKNSTRSSHFCRSSAKELDKAQQGFRTGDISEVFLPVSGFQFQSVTICNRLTTFFLNDFSIPSSNFLPPGNPVAAAMPG